MSNYDSMECVCVHMQLFEIGASDEEGGFKGPLKKACSSAATDPQSPAVLLVGCAGQCRNTQMWSNILQVIREGTCTLAGCGNLHV